MQASDLKPAGQFASSYGVKSLVYGPPGSAKTPIANTAPSPVLLATEPGLRSMAGSNVPTWLAENADKVDEFKKWISGSNEAKNYHTICIDSLSQLAEHYLVRAQSQHAHGLKAYGQMAEDTLAFTEFLYFVKYKHTYLICKEEVLSDMRRRPYFPGKDLNTKIPHRYDLIMRCAVVAIPSIGERLAFQCKQDAFITARFRSEDANKLDMFEPPDLGRVFKKLST